MHALSNGTGGAVGRVGSGLLLPLVLAGALGSSDGAWAVSEPPAVGSSLGAAEADCDGSLVAAGVGAGGCTCSAAYTARNRSSAVWPTSRTSSSCCTFGTVTMIWLSPDVVTSDSPTPRLSTRLWMMVLAS